MNRYNEVTTRFKVIGGREFPEGSTVRTVSLSDKDVKILNGMQNEHGVMYVKEETAPAGPTKSEIRSALLAKANELGIEFKKNISNEELKKLIED